MRVDIIKVFVAAMKLQTFLFAAIFFIVAAGVLFFLSIGIEYDKYDEDNKSFAATLYSHRFDREKDMGINVNRGNRVAINGYFEDENGNKYSLLMKIALKAALEVRQSINLSSYLQLLNASWEPLTLWSSDFHISPIADIKYLLQPVFEVEVNSSKRDVVKMKVSIIDKSLSGHCHLTNTCQRYLL